MKDYIVDLEIAKELRENGYPQTGKYYYHIAYLNNEIFIRDHPVEDYENWRKYYKGGYCIPDLNELLKELENFPIMIISNWNNGKEYQVSCDKGSISIVLYNKNPSNALAKLYIRLKKEGYLNV